MAEIVMSLVAYLDLRQPTSERRTVRRRALRLEAAASTGPSETVVIHDLSEEGMLIECTGGCRIGERIDVEIPEAGPSQAVVAWNSGPYYGCRFQRPISTAAVSAALLKSPAPPSEEERSQVLYNALVELRALAQEIERITDRVDRAIDQLSARKKR